MTKMIRSRQGQFFGLLACGVLGSLGCQEVLALSHGISARIWYAQYDAHGRWDYDNGRAPLYMIYYDLENGPWSFMLMGGMGNQWEYEGNAPSKLGGEFERTDVQIGVGRQIGYFSLAIAYHYFEYIEKGSAWIPRDYPGRDEFEWYYHGPELCAGVGYPLWESGCAVRASVTLLPYLQVEADLVSSSANTYGFSYDLGLSYNVDRYWVAAGYRTVELEADDDPDSFCRYDNEVHGPYAEAGVSW